MPQAELAPAGARVLVMAKSYVLYLVKMVLPVNLLPLYPYPQDVSLFSAEYFLPLLVMAAVTVACFYAARRQKVLPTVWAYYLITLIPVIGIVQVGEQAMADRYTYLPSIGPFLLAGLGAARVADKVRSAANMPRRTLSAVFALTTLVAVVLSVLTIRQLGIWKSDIELWTRVIEQGGVPHYIPYYNRATSYLREGFPDKAIPDFNKAAELKPNWYVIYNNRGLAFDRLNFIDQALADYDRAVAMFQDDPSPYRNRGFANMKVNRTVFAQEDFQRACALGDGFSCAMSLSLKTGGR